MTVDEATTLLRNATQDRSTFKAEIERFQVEAFKGRLHGEKSAVDILCELAYDLDYFEPNPTWRAEDTSFFDEDRAVAEIVAALKRVDALPRLD